MAYAADDLMEMLLGLNRNVTHKPHNLNSQGQSRVRQTFHLEKKNIYICHEMLNSTLMSIEIVDSKQRGKK